MEPRKPRPADDDDAPGLPGLDGAHSDTALETRVDLDVRDDEASALEDVGGSDLEGTLDGEIDAEDATPNTEDGPLAPLDADPTLATGENERWTEGSDASEDTPWQEAAAPETHVSAIDRGEEGFDDLGDAPGDSLTGLPAARTGDTDDEDAEQLDVNEASVLDTRHAEDESVPALPRAAMATVWHGPTREAARAIAVTDGAVLVAARDLWRITDGTHRLARPFESEVSAVLFTVGDPLAWIATDAGEVWRRGIEGDARAHARPGTDDASLGGLELAAIADVVVARTRGGALFRSNGEGWIGPIVAKNVRRIRAGLDLCPDWLVAVVGSASAPELLATRDARTFERLRVPEIIVDASRSGDVIAAASAAGRLFVSRDAGGTYAAIPSVIDVERVWTQADGVVYAATFHEATDHGRLVRVREAAAEVVLDVAAEITARRLSGPGDPDGDGRVHALARTRGALWVATGVGVFELVSSSE